MIEKEPKNICFSNIGFIMLLNFLTTKPAHLWGELSVTKPAR